MLFNTPNCNLKNIPETKKNTVFAKHACGQWPAPTRWAGCNLFCDWIYENPSHGVMWAHCEIQFWHTLVLLSHHAHAGMCKIVQEHLKLFSRGLISVMMLCFSKNCQESPIFTKLFMQFDENTELPFSLFTWLSRELFSLWLNTSLKVSGARRILVLLDLKL